ncbi:unnamed protein product [Gadus morhua 'NCC']
MHMFVVWAGCLRGLSDIHTHTYIIAPAIKRLGGGMQVRLNSISVAAAARTRIPLSTLLLSPHARAHRVPISLPAPSALPLPLALYSRGRERSAARPDGALCSAKPRGPVFGIRKALLLCDWTDERKDSSDISCGCFNSDASLPRLCSQLPGHIRSNDEHGIAASL